MGDDTCVIAELSRQLALISSDRALEEAQRSMLSPVKAMTREVQPRKSFSCLRLDRDLEPN